MVRESIEKEFAMKKVICILLAAFLMIGLCACVEREDTESEVTSTKNESIASSESSEAAGGSDGETAPSESEASTPDEGSDTESNNGVLFDENGNVILSDPPTYKEILALHEQDPDTYRDPGELQPETKEMLQLEDGQWYQSYVASSFNCRFIFLSGEEFEMSALWTFIPIGSAENAFLYNAGAMYDDPSGEALYREHAVAVRGTLAEGTDGYAYQLQLPDELIVCLEKKGWSGLCYLAETGTLAIPETYASLFEGKTGEVVVTGVVMRDKNDVFYLKNVKLYP